jgi:ring-1,2-phenylacetyl-CoA epoxidase subunit PaaC
MQDAINEVWPFTGELFIASDIETEMLAHKIAIDLAVLKNIWIAEMQSILVQANIEMPENVFMHTGGKQGKHSDAMGKILPEVQYLQHVYPGATW